MLQSLHAPLPAEAPLHVAREIVARGRLSVRRGAWDQASADLELGFALSRALDAKDLTAECLLAASVQEIHRGAPASACLLASSARDFFERAAMPAAAMGAEIVEYFAKLDADHADTALRSLGGLRTRMLAPNLALGSNLGEGRVLGYMGNSARALGETGAARTLYASALAKLDADEARRAVGSAKREQSFVSVFAMDLAICDLLDGQTAIGLQRLQEAESRRVQYAHDEQYLRYLIAHYASLAALLSGVSRDDPPDMPCQPWQSPSLTYLEDTRVFAARFGASAPLPARLRALAALRDSCPLFDHARISLQLCAVSAQAGVASARALLVGPDAAYFELPQSGRVSLQGRAAPRKLLAALVARRLSHPGAPVAIGALIEAAWPGEKMSPAAQRNRLHVALSALRSLGLREVLCGDARGYWIDTHANVLCAVA